MPVPTDTFWNIKKLNVLFAASAVLMLASFGLLIKEDQNVLWRGYQKDSRVWVAAMTEEDLRTALTPEEEAELSQLKDSILQIEAELKNDTTLKDLEAQRKGIEGDINKATLPAARVKGELTPLSQIVEKNALEYGPQDPRTLKTLEALNKLRAESRAMEKNLTSLDAKLSEVNHAIETEQARLSSLTRSRDDMTRRTNTLKEKLDKAEPPGWWAEAGETIRNAPLSDWFNPSLAVQQVVVHDVRTDLNFLTVDSIDRCNTCHVNIDNAEFDEKKIVAFAERQIAVAEGQDLDAIAPGKPVVMLEFWVNAAKLRVEADEHGIPALANGVKALRATALERVNALRATAGMAPLGSDADVSAELVTLLAQGDSKNKEGEVVVTRAQWYAPVADFAADLRELLHKNLTKAEHKSLRDLYRHTLIGAYNASPDKSGSRTLSANPVLLAHPNLALYADPESKHPMKSTTKSMGCTVCHEGSGQETIFEHTAHTPRDIWVDAKTGSPVPDFLVKLDDAHHGKPAASHAALPAGLSLDGAQVAFASATAGHADDAPASGGAPRSSAADVNLSTPSSPEPFAPDTGHHVEHAAYVSPSAPPSAESGKGKHKQEYTVVRQQQYWTKAYGWAHVHYMHWEKPMNSLDYIESSCIKCHTEVFDLKDSAPRLVEGRKLFAQLGCVNCHAVDSIKDQLDIKKVGPSLVHASKKLSAEMMASWIWSPKGFRPTTRMPHYFMLENNSSPADILRTRTEVAAMTYYLQHAAPPAEAQEYKPEPPPSTAGDAKAGRAVFNSVGCLACHTNMAETGEKWITEDMVKRTGVTADEAKKQFAAMDYNQQHWYAMNHLQSKMTLVGPELSGVGTKLKAGRKPEDARAWLYDWVRNPRHYSSYTIMPSLRLSEQEANDLSAYLLSLERPGYTPVDFTQLDDGGKVMLDQLVRSLPDPTGKVTVASGMNDKLAYVGKKVITHYGCNGCHAINGFENATSACAELNEWGLKDPHKLDFGYFDHAYTKKRAHPIELWKVDHEGLTANAPQIKAAIKKAEGDSGAVQAEVSPGIQKVAIEWEEMDLERRPWLYHKLHNTRVYDRGRKMLDSPLDTPQKLADAVQAALEAGEGQTPSLDIGQPFDKIKMPKFFLTDDQVKAVVTFVTGVRKPLVSDRMKAMTYTDAARRDARGRQAATVLNCYGCHNIEGNTVDIHKYMDVFNDDGSLDPGRLNEVAPPRLIGQGSRTQPEWMHYFLRNVHPLRPWLKVRMPSFAWHNAEGERLADGIVDYFAGASKVMSDQLTPSLAAIDAYRKANPDDAQWFMEPARKKPRPVKATQAIASYAIRDDLKAARDFDPRQASPEELAATWERLLVDVKLLKELNDVRYPFVLTPRPNPDAERFARGKALYTELRCFQCHALGDEQKLMESWTATFGQSSSEPPAAEEPAEEGYGDESEGDGYGDEGDAAAPVALGPVYSAPNLRHTSVRLQWNWVYNWLQNPNTIQPGTKMPQWFPDGKSAFWNRPDEQRDNLHSMYGFTGPDQMQALMDFVYAAGLRNYTFYPPDWKVPQGGVAEAPVELKALTPPPQIAAEAKPADPSAKPAGEAATTPAATAKPAETKPAHEEPTHSSIELTEGVTDYKGTRVVGVVKFGGKPPRRAPVRMEADAYCVKQHKTRPLNRSLIVNDDQSMQYAFVYVKSGLPAGAKFEPQGTPEIDQVGCEYTPRIVGAMVGQPVLFINGDATLHNVSFSSQFNGRFNEGMPAKGMKTTKTFSKPEMGATVKCDVHPWMLGYVHIMPHPFFAASDVEGRFEIKGLPAGKYTLEAIHEDKAIAPVTFEVTVEADKSVRADVTLVRQ